MTRPGHKFGGRYEVTEPIASGGMAEVFLARDNLLGRKVALKVLHPEYARDNAFITRFRREAQAAASLNDPRVVSIFDWGSDDGTYYIVMEYVQGRTLRDIIQAEGSLMPQRAAEIAADVATALHIAHQQGIVHRDIKSANIAVTPGGQTKVMDFGIARGPTEQGQTVTQTGTVIGTAAYLSPEQAQGLPVDPRSDVYSTAVVLYEMLTGDVPFKAETPVGVAYKHVKEDAAPPSDHNPEIPPELDAIVLKGMSKNPDNRYQSAQEMGRDLKRWLAGRPVEATPIMSPDETAIVRRGDQIMVAARGADTTRVMRTAEPPRGRRALVYGLTFLLFFGILVAAVALLFSLFGRGGPVIEVPDVVGMDLDEALRILDSRGLTGVVDRREFHETHPAGTVISQDPEDGFKVRSGHRVRLVVSRGAERIDVPEVVGQTREDAERTLEESGLEVGAVRTQASDDVPEGVVISQDPPAGRSVERGTPVDLVVSSGRQIVRVPDVTGFSEERARQILLDRNLNPVVRKVCRTSERDDIVLSQDPAAQTDVPEGSDVTITVNDTQTVPNVETKTEEEAKAQLRAAGFEVEPKKKKTNNVFEKGKVISQSPSAGTSACKGDTVTIEVGE